jgi:predicted MPP superfamily phosphohydrolase
VVLPYNLVMLAVDLVAIAVLRRRKGLVTWFVTMALAGAAALVAGGLLVGHEDDGQPVRFGVIRLWTHGIFLHGVVLLAATAVLWRRHRPALAAVAAFALLGLALIGIDAVFIEPTWLDVSHRRIESPKIHRPVRIVVVADLQMDRMGRYEREVLRRALDEKPDILLFAGDYIQARFEQRERLQTELHNYLAEIHVERQPAAFAVRGNVDGDRWYESFAGLGVTAVDYRQSFNLGEVQLTCLGLAESFWLFDGPPVRNPRPGRFHVVLGHVPNFAMGPIDADLLLAGHTHGGQVRLPWLGALVTNCHIPRAWAAGLTELPSGAKLLVSRGIGMERGDAPPIRFLCRPELAVIDLVPESKGTNP